MDPDGVIYTVTPTRPVHPSLAQHLASPFVQTVRHADRGGYRVRVGGGRELVWGGLLKMLESTYYPHYKSNRSRRNHKTVAIKGSSRSQGKRVDADLAAYTAGTKPYPKLHRMAQALVDHWRDSGHELVACQVPVQVEYGRVTQADVITRDTLTGRLWLAEIKSGWPVSLERKQGTFAGSLAHVECTKKNIWQLQLLRTQMALEAAGVEFAGASVIQVYETRPDTPIVNESGKRKRAAKGPLKIKVHPQPAWTGREPTSTKKRK